jgi:hypothetical protein
MLRKVVAVESHNEMRITIFSVSTEFWSLYCSNVDSHPRFLTAREAFEAAKSRLDENIRR